MKITQFKFKEEPTFQLKVWELNPAIRNCINLYRRWFCMSVYCPPYPNSILDALSLSPQGSTTCPAAKNVRPRARDPPMAAEMGVASTSGSSSWSSSCPETPPTPTASGGSTARKASSRSRTPRKWPPCGAPARTGLWWTTTNWAAPCASTTRKESSRKPRRAVGWCTSSVSPRWSVSCAQRNESKLLGPVWALSCEGVCPTLLLWLWSRAPNDY